MVGEHVWLESGDGDLFGPATVVHTSKEHTSLQVTRYAGAIASQQKVVVTVEAFGALAPIVDLGELALVEAGKIHDAAAMRAPSGPTLLHLLRRRYAHGRPVTWLRPWLRASLTKHPSTRHRRRSTSRHPFEASSR